MNFTPEQEQIIIKAQETILNSGQYFSVNGPESFVRDEIGNTDVNTARQYWTITCRSYEKFSNPIIAENQEKLRAMHTFKMPEWGIK